MTEWSQYEADHQNLQSFLSTLKVLKEAMNFAICVK